MTTGSFDTLLVANRGEIAVRVLHTAGDMGLRTVAVHSDADADATHVRAADQAVRIGPARAAASYLDGDAVLDAARRTGAGAIHPGYGFLAEDAAFARACEEAGIVFVGPPADAIAAMGDKAAAKRLLADHGVPLVDGYEGEDQSDDRLADEAARIGFPVMVKAAAGGGGTGMRLVTDPDGLSQALAGARREAASAFGNDHLILERALVDARHVEVQVLADAHGRTLALGERDCSVQRRHQKVVEEAPCPVLDDATRTAMGDAAVAAARAVGYVGAGTVEFLLAPDGSFAFLEMNTRLQVEHPVTELVTGLDLVEWQLRVAAGEPLALGVPGTDGHAIEARLYAEDPARGFLPQTGVIHVWEPPRDPGVRVDDGIRSGSSVTADYDPMLAKVVAHGRDRDQARRRLVRALERTRLVGPVTNRSHLLAVLDHPTFAAGEATTAFLDDHDVEVPPATAADVVTIAAVRHLRAEAAADRAAPGLGGFSTRGWARAHQRLVVGDGTWEVTLVRDEEALRVQAVGAVPDDGDRPRVSIVGPRLRDEGDGWVEVVVDGIRRRLSVLGESPWRSLVTLARLDLVVVDELLLPPDAVAAAGAGVLMAPMHGAVTALHAAVGDRVAAGDPLLSVEAMKMEHVVVADLDGTITELVDEGTQVASDAVVARIESEDPADRPAPTRVGVGGDGIEPPASSV